MNSDNDNPKRLLPRLSIYILDKKPIFIGGLDNPGGIDEINFYSYLNSFAFNANISITDPDNTVLNMLSELNGSKATICMYELPEIKEPNQTISTDNAIKVFQKTFSIDKIEVKELNAYNSKLKIHLRDIYDSLVFNKVMCYSNFNIKWTSSEMNPEVMIHRLLRNYEKYVGKMIIPPDIFGVTPAKLKRRFATDRITSLRNVFYNYIDKLYNTRWYEYLTKSHPVLDIPTCLLAYGNLYTLDNDGILHQRPYLTSSNLFDQKPDKYVYSLPYPKTGKILDYAHKDYNISIEDTTIDLRGGTSGDVKEKLLAIAFRKFTFDPKREFFEDNIKRLEKIYQLNPTIAQDIESQQDPTYLGIGEDPIFTQMKNFNKSTLLEYPFNVRDNKYYFSNGENSFYKDMCELLMKARVFVSIPYAAWHSPGQEIDLRMITSNYDSIKPEKNQLFSFNKLISGRWKILNSCTTFKKDDNDDSGTMAPKETVGLVRMYYFHGDKKEN